MTKAYKIQQSRIKKCLKSQYSFEWAKSCFQNIYSYIIIENNGLVPHDYCSRILPFDVGYNQSMPVVITKNHIDKIRYVLKHPNIFIKISNYKDYHLESIQLVVEQIEDDPDYIKDGYILYYLF